jgi:IS5 family transposase
MRLKAESVLEFGPDDNRRLNKTVREYREQYKTMGRILDQHPKILGMVHGDLEKLSKAKSPRGRKADFTSENLFRAILVMQHEGLDYREASVRIAESETLQTFCKLIKKPTIDFTLLNKAFCAIRPQTWENINQLLGLKAVAEEVVSIEHLRNDTTVTECNIHWPTDSSLLWDTYRVIARELTRARQLDPLSCPWRFHDKKIKNMDYFIARYSGSHSKTRLQTVGQKMKTLIARVEEVLGKAEQFVAYAKCSTCLELMALGASLADHLPVMRRVSSAW